MKIKFTRYGKELVGMAIGIAIMLTAVGIWSKNAPKAVIPEAVPETVESEMMHSTTKMFVVSASRSSTLPYGPEFETTTQIIRTTVAKATEPTTKMVGTTVEKATEPTTKMVENTIPATTESTRIESTMSAEALNWDGPVLNAYNGTVQGPSGKETYYNLDMSGVLSIMRGIGNTDEYWVRSDGMKMLGNYIMVAADLSIRPRGSLVPTSRGMGIVCDTGSFIYQNPYQLDLAVNW